MTALAAGTVTSLPIVTGIQVAQGQTVAVLNARGGTTEVDAPVPGTIDQIYVTPGSFVGPGTPVAEMLPLGSPMSALMFVGAGEGKALRVGMSADISPSTAPSSQYGSISGVVTYISPLPLTQQRLVTLLGDRPGLIATVAQLGHRSRWRSPCCGTQARRAVMRGPLAQGPASTSHQAHC